MFKSKKGDVRVEPISILGLEIIPGVLMLLLFLFILVIIIGVFVYLTQSDCTNKAEWKQVEEALDKLDNSNDKVLDIQFYNKGCYIVGFSDPSENQNTYILKGKGISVGTQLCLCNLDDIKCNAYKCKKLETVKLIKDSEGKQLNTKDYLEYTTLKFKKEGKTLSVGSSYLQKIDLFYNHKVSYNELDKGLIQEMKLEINRKEGSVYTNFIPLITIKQTPALLPESIPQNSLFFDIDLKDITGMQDVTIQGFETIANQIEPNTINSIEFTFIFTKKILEEHNIVNPGTLHFLNDNSWSFIQLNCKKEISGQDNSPDEDYSGQEEGEYETGNVLCSGSLKGYKKEFALSE